MLMSLEKVGEQLACGCCMASMLMSLWAVEVDVAALATRLLIHLAAAPLSCVVCFVQRVQRHSHHWSMAGSLTAA